MSCQNFNSLRRFPSFVPAAPWLTEPAAKHRCQQWPADLIFIGRALDRDGMLYGIDFDSNRLHGCFMLQRGFLFRGFDRCHARRLLPLMAFIQCTRQASRSQQTSQGPACRQAPAVPRLDGCSAWPAVRSLAPGIHAGLEVLQRSRYDRIVDLCCDLVFSDHFVPLNSARTLLTARDKCAFTVPSLNPVARAISLNSCSST